MTIASPDYVYACFGLSIRSAFALPEIEGAAALEREGPKVEITQGPLPAELPGASTIMNGLQVSGEDILLSVRDVARYLVRGGRQIVVDALPGGSPRNVRLFLLGSAFGILCFQRGLLPLHANAIVAGGNAIAFAGPSGAGKSTLAAFFQSRGYDVLCDDVCVISFDSSGIPSAWPGLPRLKLWRDAAASFGHDSDHLERAVDGIEKFHVPLVRGAGHGPFPFRRLYVLAARDSANSGGEIVRLRGIAAIDAILGQVYRDQYLRPMGLVERNFSQCSALLRHIQVYSAPREWGTDVFEREAQKLERHIFEA